MTMRVLLGVALAVALRTGSAGWKGAPYNAQEACEGSGGTYTSDGECLAGME
jgi:hypothetical protein